MTQLSDLNPTPLPPKDRPLTIAELRSIFGGDWRALAQIISVESYNPEEQTNEDNAES